MQNVGVVGGGQMGSGIAEVALRAACEVVVVESTDATAKACRGRLEKSLVRAESKGKLTGAGGSTAAEVLDRLRVETDLDAVADRDVVVEAIVEDAQAKESLSRALDDIVTAPDAILASNHIIDPDHQARRRDQPAAPGPGNPLLQPGARAAPRRAGPVPADVAGHDRALLQVGRGR